MEEYYELELNGEMTPEEEKAFEKAEQKEKKQDAESWSARAQRLGRDWVNDSPENHARWLSQIEEVFVLVHERVHNVYIFFPDEVRDKAIDYLWTDAKRFDPARDTLERFLRRMIRLRLLSAMKRWYAERDSRMKNLGKIGVEYIVSLDAPAAAGEEGTIEGLVSNSGSMEEELILVENAQELVAALVLNFAALRDQEEKAKKVRHYRMFYTEQLTFSAQYVPLPRKWRKDFLNALHRAYFCYFSDNAPKAEEVELGHIENVELKTLGQVIPGKSMDEPLTWNKHALFPADVQISYLLAEEGVKVGNSTVSDRLKEYRQALAMTRLERE